MRLIPGKTKVKVELFKGVRIADLIIGAVLAGLIVLVVTSNLPGKFYIALGLLLVAAVLLVRLDNEPNYKYVLHILRHLGYKRHYAKTHSDEMLRARQDEEYQDIAVSKLFAEETAEKKSKRQQKAEEKERKAKRKAEDKLLKSSDTPEEEKEAIRAQRKAEFESSAKKMAEVKEAELSRDAMDEVIPFTHIEDNLIHYGKKYYGAVLEVPAVEFRFYSEYRRSNAIENGLGRVLRALPPDYAANIVKLERPINYDAYRKSEYDKLEQLRRSYERGFTSEDELKARTEILFDRLSEITALCTDSKVVAPFYYIVLFDSDKGQLNHQIRAAEDTLITTELPVHRLNTKELALFLKYTNQIDFNEDEINEIAPEDYAEWAMPDTLDVKGRTVLVNHMITHNMRVVRYPTVVGDSWLAGVMSIPNTKVVIKCRPMDRAKSIRSIDRSLQELRGQYAATGVDSKRIELAGHIDTLAQLLSMLQNANETLLETNVYITAYDIAATRNDPRLVQPSASIRRNISNLKRTVRRYYQEAEMRLNNMEFDQMNAFIGSQISGYDPLSEAGQGIPSNSLAACYPWIFASVSDAGGVKLGSSEGVPVFIDFFRRDSERVNSNMVIVGKSGSGKSYATKSLLANLAADDAKIFILDPENEYTELAENLHGKFINVGNAQYGRLNPFHIITALDDDESDGSTVSGSYATHLQFLEEFFRQILPDCEKDAMEYLNSLVDRMYTNMGITAETDLSKLTPEDYPVFDDLYDAILAEFQSTDNDYIRTMLRTLMNYIAKFSTGGRNANIWNGPSTVTTAENFTVFNFQSLLANRNGTIANAQMLLVLKYIDNEIIKNRDYNTKYGLKRKVVVVIDEAHVFIDTKYPIALDFMFQLAKRIRKYNGMQIVITQNIKDFVGSEEIARKSTAIINACQYSFIFSLAPNDMQDLCKLYEKAGGINEVEQEQIVSAPRGQAFTILSPQSRTNFKVQVADGIVDMFRQPGHVNGYYLGENGEARWDEFLGESRALHEAAMAAHRRTEEEAAREESRNVGKTHVVFKEISEEELAAAQAESKPQSHAQSKPQVTLTEWEDDFPEIPEIPDDPDAFRAMTEQAQQPAAPAVPAMPTAIPAMQPVVMPTAAPSVSPTEQMLSELLGKFSYDTMLQEIRRSVREEVEKEVGVRPTSVPAEAAPTAAIPTEAAESVPLGSIFNEDAMAEAQRLAEEETFAESASTSDETSDEEGGGLDIMALLNAEVANMNSTSPIDMMDIYGETVIEITLEELAQYNSKH